MKIRTAEQLDDFLAGEISWRKRELTSMKFLISSAKKESRAVLLRAGVSMLYAHWEGFIKAAGNGYLNFVSNQRLRYGDLSVPLLAAAARRRLHEATTSSKMDKHLALTEFFMSGLSEACVIPMNMIRTRSNLSSTVLKDIVMTLGLDYSIFATKEVLIDESLVFRRNSIAHGEYLDVGVDDFQSLSAEVVALMETFRTQVDNAAAMRSFRK
jgi:hypothetical protein